MTFDRSEPASHVLVVDDDRSVRDSLSSLFRSVGHAVTVFTSAAQFFESAVPDGPSCLVVDVRLPGMSGLDFHDALRDAGVKIPTIFITGHGDIPMVVRAMKAGATEFLTKPFRDQDLLDIVHVALQNDAARREQDAEIEETIQKYMKLTPREQEILNLVAEGLISKQIAANLGVSEITVKVHRSHAMRKMQAASLPQLVRMIDRLQIGLSA